MKIKTYEDGSIAITESGSKRIWTFSDKGQLERFSIGSKIFNKDKELVSHGQDAPENWAAPTQKQHRESQGTNKHNG